MEDQQKKVDSRPLYKRKRVWAGGVALFAVGVMAAGGNSSSATAGGEPSPKVTVTKTATATVTATVEAEAKPAVTVTASVEPADAKPSATKAASGTLPSLVGLNHQEAQDRAQAAGFFQLREKDASGQERLLVWDRNWKVCRQEPAAGRHSTKVTVTLYAVKEAESCP